MLHLLALPSVPWLTSGEGPHHYKWRDNVGRIENEVDNRDGHQYNWQPNAGAIEKVSRSNETGVETFGRHYNCRPNVARGKDVENVSENEENNSDNVSRLHNWPDRRDTLNDGVGNVSRSKVNLQCSASASGKQHDREDLSLIHI